MGDSHKMPSFTHIVFDCNYPLKSHELTLFNAILELSLVIQSGFASDIWVVHFVTENTI